MEGLGRIAAGVLVLTCIPAIAAADTTAADTTDAVPKPNQVVTVAGTGEAGYSGDGGNALDARLGDSLDIAVGPDGSVYIADHRNDRLRVVDDDRVIDTVAGTRARRSPRRDVPVADGWIFSPRNTPQAVTVGDDGTVYVAASENIYRIDGNGTPTVIGGGGDERFDDGEGDDGGPAVDAWIYKPSDIAVDASGNVYIADRNNHRISKIDTEGTITTIAGGGALALDEAVGGPATEADAGMVQAVAVDSRGNVYFGQERGSPSVWKVDPDGMLSIAAGTGTEGFSGDGGPAVDAQLRSPPSGLAVDADDNVYLTDMTPGHVRKIDGDGVITTVGPAVTGFSGDVAVGPDGNVYVTADAQVKMLALRGEEPAPAAEQALGPDPWADEEPGAVITVAGTGEEPEPGSAGVVARALAEPSRPRSVAVAGDGSLVYADPAHNQVLRVTADRAVSTVAGTGEHGFSGDDGAATEAELSRPSGVAFDADGTLFIADSGNRRVRAVDPSGVITTVAGSGREIDEGELDDQALGDGGPASEAMLADPRDVTVTADGRLFIADGHGRRVRVVEPDGTIRTIAGGGDLWADEADDNPATEASLWTLDTVAADADGNVYFTGDGLPSVRMVNRAGVLTTVAGDAYLEPGQGGFGGDGGPATEAELNTPSDLAIGADGALYIADTFNSRVRRVDARGVITTVAGTGERHDSGDGGPATEAAVNEPGALAFDTEGNLYIAGESSDTVRRVDTDGVITMVVDLAEDQATDESARAVDTPMGRPLGLAIDPAGVLYVAETQTGLVRRVAPDGTIGSVASVYEHFGQPPFNLAAVAHGTDGFLYVAAGTAVLRVYPDGSVVTVAGGGISKEPPDTLPQATTAMLAPTALAAGPNGSLYIADAHHQQVYRLDRDGGLTSVAKDERIGGVTAMAVDRDGNVYLDEQLGNVVRTIAPDGTVSVFAGSGETSYDPDDLGDGVPATEAAVISPRGVAVHGDDVYISTLHGIRRVDGAGTMTTVAESTREQDGNSTTYKPADMLTFDAHGNLYYSETQRNRVRVLVRPGEIREGISPAVLIAGVAALIAAGAFVVVRRRRSATPDTASSGEGPLGRLATPDDVAGTALFLASRASDFITGETILVDGGWRTAK